MPNEDNVIDPLTEENFTTDNLSITDENKYTDYKFSKFFFRYKYDNTTSDSPVVKLSGLKVRKAFPPYKDPKTGTVGKYPKIFVLFELANEKQLDMIKSILDFTDKKAFEVRKKIPSLEDYETFEELLEDELNNRKSIFRNADEPMVIGLSFPVEGLAAPNDKQAVKIVYRDPTNKPSPDVSTCGDVDVILPRDTVCEVFFQPQCMKVSWQGGAYTMMANVHKRINVTTYVTPGEGSGGGSKKINGVKTSDFDTESIVLGVRDPEEKRRIKPKMKYTNSKDEEKLRSISVNVCGADIYMSRRENTNENGEVSYSWSMAIGLNDEQAEAISSIEQKLHADFINNSAKLLGLAKNKTVKKHPYGYNDKACFRTSLYPPNDKSDKHTLWVSVFAKDPGSDVPDFCDNFFKPGSSEEVYTNEEVMNIINNQRHTGVDLNIYIKHIWFLNNDTVQTIKWCLGNATVDANNVGVNVNVGDETSMFSDVTTKMGGEGSAFSDVVTSDVNDENGDGDEDDESGSGDEDDDGDEAEDSSAGED